MLSATPCGLVVISPCVTMVKVPLLRSVTTPRTEDFARFDASARTKVPLLSYATMLPCLKSPAALEIFTSILLVGLRNTSNGLLPKILVVDMKFSYQIRP